MSELNIYSSGFARGDPMSIVFSGFWIRNR